MWSDLVNVCCYNILVCLPVVGEGRFEALSPLGPGEVLVGLEGVDDPDDVLERLDCADGVPPYTERTITIDTLRCDKTLSNV